MTSKLVLVLPPELFKMLFNFLFFLNAFSSSLASPSPPLTAAVAEA
jgi:hypothetical protein